jgi:hypothetical protein
MVRLSAFFVKAEVSMPRNDGRLTEEELAKLQKWFKEKWNKPTCPACQSSSWTLDSHCGLMPVHTPKKVLLGGPSYLFVPVICDVCCFSMLFNLPKMGIFDLNDFGGEEEGGKDAK